MLSSRTPNQTHPCLLISGISLSSSYQLYYLISGISLSSGYQLYYLIDNHQVIKGLFRQCLAWHTSCYVQFTSVNSKWLLCCLLKNRHTRFIFFLQGKLYEFQSSGVGGTHSPPAMPHCLQRRTARTPHGLQHRTVCKI